METRQKQSEVLLGLIRDGQPMTRNQKLNLIVQLSIPSILAQITSVMMFFIDQAMVGRIGVEAAAACGLVESSTWLCGSLTSAASMGFSVQVAHFIGANDFRQARQVFRHGLICALIFSVVIGIIGVSIAPKIPYWLGGGADIAHDASIYFGVFMLVMPFFQLNSLAGAMLKCSGNMRIPSIMSILMCVMDVVFNFIFIFVFHLGVLGVAIGTGLAIVIGALVQAYYAIFRSSMLALVNREARSKKQEARDVTSLEVRGERREVREYLSSWSHCLESNHTCHFEDCRHSSAPKGQQASSPGQPPGGKDAENGRPIGAKALFCCRAFALTGREEGAWFTQDVGELRMEDGELKHV